MNPKIAVAMLAVTVMIVASIAATQESTDNAPKTATGCLQGNTASNTYVLTDENGKTWNLRSTTVRLSSHVGHTITVTGTIPKEPKDSTDTSPQNHLLVTKLEMVRDSCKQP